MKINKFFAGIFFASLVCLSQAASRDAVYESSDYNINLSYSDTAQPGDAVFIRMKMTAIKSLKHPRDGKTQAKVLLSSKKKELNQAAFFSVNPSRKSSLSCELFAGLPLSSYLDSGNYTLTVVYTLNGLASKEFTLPLEITPKVFTEETIPLSENNTALRTDTSPERIAQIEKLNAIFAAADATAVFSFSNFQLPVLSDRRTSGFADRRIYEYSTGKKDTALHYGIDFGVPEGTEVASCGSGKVILAENRISTGWSVVIEHLPGLYSIYYHMNSLKVSENQMVKKGDIIGLSGATGMATGPHLHWEIRLNGKAVNPDLFLSDFAFIEKKN